MNNTLSPLDSETTPKREVKSLLDRLGYLLGQKSDASLRETIEEYIEEPEENSGDSTAAHERVLLSNILQLRDVTVDSVMVPRADILALSSDTTQKNVLKFFAEVHVSRVPVYEESLDNVIGTVHIKDILGVLAQDLKVVLPALVTDIPVISPSMPLLDLLLEMRQSRRHMALVVDEYGGVDGLLTIGDVIEAIVGEIDDEHDLDDEPEMGEIEDGAIIADARVSLDVFCEKFDLVLDDEELGEVDTLGGLVFHVAGRVPARGEVIQHDNGMVFEILEADPRRIYRLRVRDIPAALD